MIISDGLKTQRLSPKGGLSTLAPSNFGIERKEERSQ
jgi:hypothetical protein